MFDDEKIRLIEAVPEADMILVIWIKLLTLAGKKNMNGYIFLTENIPYTDEMLATLFNRPINTIRLALDTFKNFGMINYNGEGQIRITNWEKHQNIEGLERIRELNKKRATDYRKRLMVVGGNNYLEHYQEVYQRDEGKCVYCGSINDLCIDHLIPLIKGGDNEVDNLVLACKPCNAGKSGKLIENIDYHFINDKTSEQYNKVKARLKITHNVTQNHALRLDIDKIRLDKKENIKKDKKESSQAGLSEKKETEFSFTDKCWYNLEDWQIKMWQSKYPMLTVNYELQDLMKSKLLQDPEKYKILIKDKYGGDINKFIWAWLEQSKKLFLKNHPNWLERTERYKEKDKIIIEEGG